MRDVASVGLQGVRVGFMGFLESFLSGFFGVTSTRALAGLFFITHYCFLILTVPCEKTHSPFAVTLRGSPGGPLNGREPRLLGVVLFIQAFTAATWH